MTTDCNPKIPKDFHKTFHVCPACSSTNRFFESLGRELKERGFARPEWRLAYSNNQGAAVDEARKLAIPVGSTVPGFIVITDICSDCGCVYAVEMLRVDARLEARPLPTPVKPRYHIPGS